MRITASSKPPRRLRSSARVFPRDLVDRKRRRRSSARNERQRCGALRRVGRPRTVFPSRQALRIKRLHGRPPTTAGGAAIGVAAREIVRREGERTGSGHSAWASAQVSRFMSSAVSSAISSGVSRVSRIAFASLTASQQRLCLFGESAIFADGVFAHGRSPWLRPKPRTRGMLLPRRRRDRFSKAAPRAGDGPVGVPDGVG